MSIHAAVPGPFANRLPSLPIVEDPGRWRAFVLDILAMHHRTAGPVADADQCSCGQPYLLCPIAQRTQGILAGSDRPGAPSHWFG